MTAQSETFGDNRKTCKNALVKKSCEYKLLVYCEKKRLKADYV